VSSYEAFLYLLGRLGWASKVKQWLKKAKSLVYLLGIEQETRLTLIASLSSSVINLASVNSALKEAIAYSMFSSSRYPISWSVLSASDVSTQSSQSRSLVACICVTSICAYCGFSPLDPNLSIRHDPPCLRPRCG
jgi:hypothetical protein